ncbi:auxilin-like clathrin-binding protein required for normal clathrin function [Coemansia brasiliensis]|uniref:Auxilin-like clathrin-binding protein required for normal clathrin function n=1 Tax=Coemansia brasiliensis TaxID=2650707 RepID=A0A9W8IFC0_9FUNG|nr:auxilin-like clathrin-binding protein required for normal clathrin function [Coemansia brasiliensis]
MEDLAGLNWTNQKKPQEQLGSSGNLHSRNAQPANAFAPNYSPSLSTATNSNSKGLASAKDDPFGELVSFSGSSQKSQASMSLRERQQQLEKEQASRSGSPFVFQQSSQSETSMFPNAAKDTWNFDALDSMSTSRSATPGIAKKPAAANMDFDPFATQPPTKPVEDLLGGYSTHSAKPAQDDLLSFSAAPPVTASTIAQKAQPGLINSSSDDDEPIPMDVRPPKDEPFVDRDFEIAQIASQGFSIEHSKAALEITGSPQAAIRLLHEQRSAKRQQQQQRSEMQQRPQSGGSRLRTPYRDTVSSSDDEQYYDDLRRNRNRPDQGSRGKQEDGGLFRETNGTDTFLATANELGSNMWKQANSWFAMGKKKLMDIHESIEQKGWPNGGSSGGWSRADLEAEYVGSSAQQRFRDYSSDSSSDDEPYTSSNRYMRPSGQRQQQQQQQQQQRQTHTADPIIDINDNDRATTKIQPAQPPPKPVRTHVSSSPAKKSPAPTEIPSLPEHVLTAATAAKTSANEQFKLGQFGEAVSGYTKAIEHVAQHANSHPLLIVLLNNRAIAQARTGESKLAVADCTQVLQLSERYAANKAVDLGAAGCVDIAEQRCKALQRRAEAFESSERYQDGLADWKLLRSVARDTNMRQQSTRGVQRCEKALGIGPVAPRAPATTSKPPPSQEDLASVFESISIASVKSGKPNILTAQTENSAAVAEMRRKEQERRQEDDQRLAILDQVELDLRKWKDGKQHNLRALLSSVHVLLPNFPPIGMHQIIEPGKVKRVYMRTIARLHPDKLSKDVDVRTKMVSSSVFSSLNEAWDVFKTQEGLS